MKTDRDKIIARLAWIAVVAALMWLAWGAGYETGWREAYQKYAVVGK